MLSLLVSFKEKSMNVNSATPYMGRANTAATIFSIHMQVGVMGYMGSGQQAKIINLAAISFGHLIKSVAKKQYTFAEFADIIEKHYDTKVAKTAEVVNTLREVHASNVQLDKVLSIVEVFEREQAKAILEAHVGKGDYTACDDDELRTKVMVAFLQGLVPAKVIDSRAEMALS